MTQKRVLVVGSGIAGLTAALDLAAAGVSVDIIEEHSFPGGRGIRLSCKATDRCVKCGACMVDHRLGNVLNHPGIRLRTRTGLQEATRNGRFQLRIRQAPTWIDPLKCTDCGLCLKACPVEGAILQGTSGYHHPFYAISEAACRYVKDKSCSACRDICPAEAIDLDAFEKTEKVKWYLEETSGKLSYEAKFKWDNRAKSVEFNSEGIIEDIETAMEFNELPIHLRQNLLDYFNTNFIKYDIRKIQEQWTGEPDDLEDAVDEDEIEDIVIFYEIEFYGKSESGKALWEGLFDADGQFIKKRKIILRPIDNLTY